MGELFSALMFPSVPCERHAQQSYSGRFPTCSFLLLFAFCNTDSILFSYLDEPFQPIRQNAVVF